MPPNISIGARSLNSVEYYLLLARTFQAADGGTATGVTMLEARQINVPAALTPPTGEAPSQNGPSNWSMKPFRRLAAPTTSVRTQTSETAPLIISPNPVQEQITVRLTITARERVVVRLYNLIGQEVASLLDAELPSGEQTLTLPLPKNLLANGTYRLHLSTDTRVQGADVRIVR
jgi:hypothetical protein